MGTIVGRNCKVEVALTFAAPVSPTGVTKAAPGVVTLNAHGLANGACGYWSVSAGMVQLDEQAFMVNNQTANTWEMPGFETTNYDTYTAGTATMAATWGTVSEGAGYSIGGGAADSIDDTRLMHVKKTMLAGNLASQDVTIDVKPGEVDGAAMAFIAAAARAAGKVLLKISKGSRVLRVVWGTPSLPGEAVQAGAAATGQFSITPTGWVVKPNV